MGCWFSAPTAVDVDDDYDAQSLGPGLGPEMMGLLQSEPEELLFKTDNGDFMWMRLTPPFEIFEGYLDDDVISLERTPREDTHDCLALRGRDETFAYKVLLMCGSHLTACNAAPNVLYTARVLRYDTNRSELLGFRDYHHFKVKCTDTSSL